MTATAPAPVEAGVTWEAIAARIAIALGHDKSEAVTRSGLESRVDTWVRAMAGIARLVGADPKDPMSVVDTVERALLGKLPTPKPRLTGAEIGAATVAAASAAAGPASAPARAPPTPAGFDQIQAYGVDGEIFIVLGGFTFAVEGARLVPKKK